MSGPYAFDRSAEQGALPSPRRQRPGQPPSLLTTSLTNAQHLGNGLPLGGGQTPVSTASLSSPFSFHHHHSPYPASPGPASRGSSPMASRTAAAFSAPYNPQQWGRLNSSDGSPSSGVSLSAHGRHSSTRAAAFAPRLVGPDEPVASPPPPYSPQRLEGAQRGDSTVASPSDTVSPHTDSSRGQTPTSAATTVSPGVAFPKLGRRSPAPTTSYQTSSPIVSAPGSFPPPPTPTSSRFRSSSKNHADRILAAMNIKGKHPMVTSPINAIDALHHDTTQALAGRSEAFHYDAPVGPPSSRRAASTGAIGLGTPLNRSANSSRSPTRRNYGSQLPPPPPGPPPPTSSARSQSLCRPCETTLVEQEKGIAPRRRQFSGRGQDLDTIPPTPADWRDDNNGTPGTWAPSSPWPRPRPLHIDTISASASAVFRDSPVLGEYSTPLHVRSASSNGMLLRSPAVRNRSAKGIRERRSESRTDKSRVLEDPITVSPATFAVEETQGESGPRDIILPPGSGDLSRRRMSSRLTPRSAKTMRGLDEALESAKSLPDLVLSAGSSGSTPRPGHVSQRKHSTSPIPLSSGRKVSQDLTVRDQANAFVPSMAAPTSPSQLPSRYKQPASLVIPTADDLRPASSILHLPNPDVPIEVMPLSPKSPSQKLVQIDEPESPKTFAHRAMTRYRNFAENEMNSKTDSERLHHFCQFMIAESRIRRERYASVFEAERIEAADLMDGLFDLVGAKNDSQSSRHISSSHGKSSRRSSGTTFSESQSRRASTTATSEPVLTLDTSSGIQSQGDQARWNDYVPCLSPIASMSAVTGRDEMDSRGRAPSRWWESHSGETPPEDGFKVLERTKRESRYMALPQEARYSPAFFEHEVSPRMNNSYHASASASSQPLYGPDEYPPEKTGWHDEPALPPPPPHPPTPLSAPFAPSPKKLDISRLITLPPPYPRHHPAVNNSHPALSETRAIVRSLNEMEQPASTKEAYRSRLNEKRTRADSWCKHQRSLHNQDIQFRMEHGEISQAQFDRAEADMEGQEAKSKKELLQAEFDLFQTSVVSPLHALFSERITKATAAFEHLSTRLSSDAQSTNPNLPQEEGDEQPELLEKLTQLKWLFEAREHLHKETYNLLSERNEKYKAIVLLPYHQSRNHEKLADATTFFDRDALSRRVAHDTAARARSDAFLATIESHVTRGVEVLLSAFWDIAPPLLSLLQEIPARAQLPAFEVLVPRAEVDDTPALWAHPLRYLYSLLSHAESSSRQFIESQVSLWCLLQEVREGAHAARWRVMESEAAGEGRELGWRGEERRAEQQRALVEDLKERVGVVEGQWEEALGGEVRRVRAAVREWLEESGGWDEELEAES